MLPRWLKFALKFTSSGASVPASARHWMLVTGAWHTESRTKSVCFPVFLHFLVCFNSANRRISLFCLLCRCCPFNRFEKSRRRNRAHWSASLYIRAVHCTGRCVRRTGTRSDAHYVSIIQTRISRFTRLSEFQSRCASPVHTNQLSILKHIRCNNPLKYSLARQIE